MKIISLLLTILIFASHAYSETTDEIRDKFHKYELSKIQKQTQKINQNNVKYLKAYDKSQKKLISKLCKSNPQMSDALYKSWNASRDRLDRVLKGSLSEYPSPLNQNTTTQNSSLTSAAFLDDEKLNASIKDYQQQLSYTETITEYMREQNSIMKNVINEVPDLNPVYKKLCKSEYYFVEQNKVFDQLFSKQNGIEKSLFSSLMKDKNFINYLKKNDLSNSFKIPDNWGSLNNDLQTITDVSKLQQFKLEQLDSNDLAKVTTNFDNTNQLVDKLKFNGISNANDLPNFKVNEMKTKPFIKRFSYGYDFQFSGAQQMYNSTSLTSGLTLKYKFNSIMSLGISFAFDLYINNLKESVNMFYDKLSKRAFTDLKLKGIVYLHAEIESQNVKSGNEPYHYKNDYNYLTGLKLIHRISSKLCVTSSILYSFNSYESFPVVFRFGFER